MTEVHHNSENSTCDPLKYMLSGPIHCSLLDKYVYIGKIPSKYKGSEAKTSTDHKTTKNHDILRDDWAELERDLKLNLEQIF